MPSIKPNATHVNASYIDGHLFNSGTEDECIKYMYDHPREMAAIMTVEMYLNPPNAKTTWHWSDCHGNSGSLIQNSL